MKNRDTTLRKLIAESKQILNNLAALDRTTRDTFSNNIWDGISEVSSRRISSYYNNINLDHRYRAAISQEDRNNLTTVLWTNQIANFIKNGIRDVWCFKKVKGKFFKKKQNKKRGFRDGNSGNIMDKLDNGYVSNSSNENRFIGLECNT